ncbi:MAG: hypothetical protein H0X51_07495 [Parachlamydiaceae bacterium]|nr:hypothetical protein [Parachlamydiaceae bacterium]
MGLVVSGVVNIGPNYVTLGNVFAFVEANISKSLLSWVDLAALQAKYPAKVFVSNSMVSLKGPVAILKSVAHARVALAVLTALVSTLIVYQLSKLVLKCACTLDPKTSQKISLAVALTAGAILAGSVYFATGSLMPLEPGVYFL